MTGEPRDVAAPADALAWVFSAGGDAGFWVTTPAQIKAAYRRGNRMLPTENDRRGRRWIRNLTEYTHLADHLSLARTVFHLAVAIDRVRTELEEIELAENEPPDNEPQSDGEVSYRATDPSTQHDEVPADDEVSQEWPRAPSSVPVPEDALMALMGIFERGTRQYREADTTVPGFRALWDRLDGDDKNLLQTYEAAVNHNSELWGDDRFRLGYALGASGLLRNLA